MGNSYVLDACALIALVKGESGAEVVALLYKEAESGDAEIVINSVNLLEVYYGFWRERGVDFADAILHSVEDSIVKITGVSRAILREAGRLKAEHKNMSLADSFALAEASTRGGYLVTADHHEMDKFELSEPNIKFRWFR